MSLFTKTVTVEKIVEVPKIVERVVMGKPHVTKLYEAFTTKTVYLTYSSYEQRSHLGWFLSCSDAFHAHPGTNIEERHGIAVGNEYFLVPRELNPITVAKPKRNK